MVEIGFSIVASVSTEAQQVVGKVKHLEEQVALHQCPCLDQSTYSAYDDVLLSCHARLVSNELSWTLLGHSIHALA